MKKKIAGLVALSLIGLLCTVYFIFSQKAAASKPPRHKCKGSARCFYGTIERVTDGDTLEINGETVRLALINTPEKKKRGYEDAKDFVERMCPIGSNVIVDEDDMQISRSHRRIIGLVYCGSRSLNEQLLKAGHAEIIEDFCGRSEFANEEWARENGCS